MNIQIIILCSLSLLAILFATSAMVLLYRIKKKQCKKCHMSTKACKCADYKNYTTTFTTKSLGHGKPFLNAKAYMPAMSGVSLVHNGDNQSYYGVLPLHDPREKIDLKTIKSDGKHRRFCATFNDTCLDDFELCVKQHGYDIQYQFMSTATYFKTNAPVEFIKHIISWNDIPYIFEIDEDLI